MEAHRNTKRRKRRRGGRGHRKRTKQSRGKRQRKNRKGRLTFNTTTGSFTRFIPIVMSMPTPGLPDMDDGPNK